MPGAHGHWTPYTARHGDICSGTRRRGLPLTFTCPNFDFFVFYSLLHREGVSKLSFRGDLCARMCGPPGRCEALSVAELARRRYGKPGSNRRAAATRQGLLGPFARALTRLRAGAHRQPDSRALVSECCPLVYSGAASRARTVPQDATAFSKPQVSVFDFSQGLQQGNSDSSLSFACDVSSTAAPSSSKVHRQGAAAVRGSGQTSRHREPCGYAA